MSHAAQNIAVNENAGEWRVREAGGWNGVDVKATGLPASEGCGTGEAAICNG